MRKIAFLTACPEPKVLSTPSAPCRPRPYPCPATVRPPAPSAPSPPGPSPSGAAIVAASKAQAQITVYTPTSGNTASADGSNYIHFNFLTDQVSNSGFAEREGYVWADRQGSYIRDTSDSIDFIVASAPNPRSPGTYYTSATPLAGGTPINGGHFEYKGLFNVFGNDPSTLWQNVTAYVGFRVAAGGGNFYYGWASVSSDPHAINLTINSFAVNHEVNGVITAGQTTAVPEPATSAALLALGAAGLVAYRKRKHLQRVAA